MNNNYVENVTNPDQDLFLVTTESQSFAKGQYIIL